MVVVILLARLALPQRIACRNEIYGEKVHVRWRSAHAMFNVFEFICGSKYGAIDTKEVPNTLFWMWKERRR